MVRIITAVSLALSLSHLCWAQSAPPAVPPVQPPAGAPPAAGMHEISMPDPIRATQFHEQLVTLQKSGLFSGLSFLASGSVIAVIGESNAVNRDLAMIQKLAELFRKGSSASAATGLASAEVVLSAPDAVMELKNRLETFRQINRGKATIPGVFAGLEFIPSGNILMVVGDPVSLDQNIATIRKIGFLSERPRAHVQMNLRVVQLSGRDRADVTLMAEAIRDMIENQKAEITMSFAAMQQFVGGRLHGAFDATSRDVLTDTLAWMAPAPEATDRPMSLPSLLVCLGAFRTTGGDGGRALASPQVLAGLGGTAIGDVGNTDRTDMLLMFPSRLRAASERTVWDTEDLDRMHEESREWYDRVNQIRDELAAFSSRFEQSTPDSRSLEKLRLWLQESESALPVWLRASVTRSVESTSRTFPAVARDHALRSLREMQRRFEAAQAEARGLLPQMEKTCGGWVAAGDQASRDSAEAELRRNLMELRLLAESVVPPPLALLDDLDSALVSFSPPPDQLASLLREYMSQRLAVEKDGAEVNYARLQSLESELNRWLRRVSEVVGRSLEDQFYQRYVRDIRLLADRQFRSEKILAGEPVNRIPDVTRDLLLAQRTVNVFISNSISLQFAPGTRNSVSATVQAELPSQSNLSERLAEAQKAVAQVSSLRETLPDLNTEEIVGALLSGGTPVQVHAGLTLTATPTVGYDAGSVTLMISTSQTLDPSGGKVTDRVVRHEISNSTIRALSYEPMVLSTLTSDMTYYEETGGIPGLRKAPIVGDIINDLPGPLRRHKRLTGVYQASVLILEPVIIPTMEDVMNSQRGWSK